MALRGFFRGDDHVFEVIVRVKEDRTPIDITGWQFTSTLKLSSELPDQPELDDQGNRQVLQIHTQAEPGEDSEQGRVYLHYPAKMTNELLPTTYEIDIQCISNGYTQTLIKSTIPIFSDVSHGER